LALVLVCVGCGGWPGAKKGSAPEAAVVDERVHFRLGKQFFREHQDQEVIHRYEELLAANPDDVATLNNLAWTLVTAADVSLRDPVRAAELAERAVSLTEGAEPAPLDTLAHCYFYGGQPEQAIQTEERALALAPASRTYQRALVSFRQAELEVAARERLRRFTGEGSAAEVELVPLEEPELPAEARRRLAEARRLLGRKAWTEARRELELVITQVPDCAPAYNYLGAVSARTGDVAEAIRFYEQALRYDPALASAWNNLAWLLATAEDEVFRDPLRALASALKAVELTGARDPDVLDTLAEAYFAAGRYQSAVEAEQKALALGGGDPEHYRRQLGRFLEALEASTR